MDSRGHIYSAPEGLIPLEDKARLDGYLRGREEAQILDAERLATLEGMKAARDAERAGR